MLRIHFTDVDLARTRVAAAADPFWEIASSLHRFQTRRGRWAYAEWHRTARSRLREQQLDKALRGILLPLFPRAAYFPDFLTPVAGCGGWDAGADAIMSTPAPQVLQEVQALDQASGAPAWTPRLTETETRAELVQVLRAYYNAVIAPHSDRVQASLEADRCLRIRALLTGGIDGLLQSLRPTMRWEPPVLHVDAYGGDRDLHLAGRGLLLVPSYFCWGLPVPIADPALPPVVVYSVLTGAPDCEHPLAPTAGSALAGVVGRSRAAILRAAAAGATTGELARAVGISASAATQHTSALRDAGLISSRRAANTVLHTLTPLGAALVQANPPQRTRAR
ncbi:winged helix-turn-helix domain-containing protein [Streptomyces sp. NBC_01718]|uniref:helix-turn-helix domain-containing protein n=1 Tax=unclassified Streptomyces TaxID=2593676 RepID=UPI0030E03171